MHVCHYTKRGEHEVNACLRKYGTAHLCQLPRRRRWPKLRLHLVRAERRPLGGYGNNLWSLPTSVHPPSSTFHIATMFRPTALLRRVAATAATKAPLPARATPPLLRPFSASASMSAPSSAPRDAAVLTLAKADPSRAPRRPCAAKAWDRVSCSRARKLTPASRSRTPTRRGM